MSTTKRGRPVGSAVNPDSSRTALLIKTSRLRKHFSQKQLASVLKVSANFIANIELDRAPLPVKYINLVSTTLYIPEYELIDAVSHDYMMRRMVAREGE